MNHSSSQEQQYDAALSRMQLATEQRDEAAWDEAACVLMSAPTNILAEAFDPKYDRPGPANTVTVRLYEQGAGRVAQLRDGGNDAEQAFAVRLRHKISKAITRSQSGPLFIPSNSPPAEQGPLTPSY